MTILTEEEAKTKWCPFARQLGATGCNRDAASSPITLCIASQCMAWRWRQLYPHVRAINYEGDDRWERQDEPTALRSQLDVPDGWTWRSGDCDTPAGWIEPVSETEKRKTGFCGLAGEV